MGRNRNVIRSTTNRLKYVIRYREEGERSKRRKNADGTTPGMCGDFMTYKLTKGSTATNRQHIRCFASSGRADEKSYYNQHRRAFTAKLRRKYREISLQDASKIADDFVTVLQIANAGHKCKIPVSDDPAGEFVYNNEHLVTIGISPPRRLAEDDVIYPGGPEYDESKTPATTASIMEFSKSDDGGEGTCPVCLEGMAGGRMKMKMPCDHSFHATCITKWLLKSHSCPMCRHQLPAARCPLHTLVRHLLLVPWLIIITSLV